MRRKLLRFLEIRLIAFKRETGIQFTAGIQMNERLYTSGIDVQEAILSQKFSHFLYLA